MDDLNNIPALRPPVGVVPDLSDPYTLKPFYIATAAISLILTTMGISLRTFVRAYVIRKLEIEDYAMIFAGFAFAAFTGVLLAAERVGQGKHQWNVSIAGVQKVVILSNIVQVLYAPAMFPAKMSVLFQIMRIFTGVRRGFVYWIVQALLWVNLCFYSGIFFTFIFACVPRAKLSNPELPGHCISTNASILATSAINIFSDFTILIVPIFAVWKLRIPLQSKLTVAAVFSTGLFACISSILRMVYSVRLTRTHDITWAISPVGSWALAEFTTVILCGCFPTIPRFVQFVRGHDKTEIYVGSYGRHANPPSFKRSAQKDTELATTTHWGTNSSQEMLPEGHYFPSEDHANATHQVKTSITGNIEKATTNAPYVGITKTVLAEKSVSTGSVLEPKRSRSHFDLPYAG